jgi:choline dehydrogenase
VNPGSNGPLNIAHCDLVPELAPFRDAMQKAWVSKGQKITEDVWSGKQSGIFRAVDTIYNGQRSTSAVFVEGKDNITIVSSTNSKSLEIVNGEVIGVNVIGPDGKDYLFKAKNEVIVSQGVFETPKLLMLSGIGPREHLASKGIKTKVNSSHVGQNLLDHPILSYCFKMKDGYGLDDHLLREGPAFQGAVEAYHHNKTGPLSSGLLELIAFPRIDERLNTSKEYREYLTKNGGVDPFGPAGQPHFEIDMVPMWASAFQWHFPTPPKGNYMTAIVDLMRPLSKNGEVKLNSSNPLEQPNINLNFFSDDLDIVAMREGVRFVDDIFMNGEGMKDVIEEDIPWAMPRHSDAAMKRQILERSQTGFRKFSYT